MCISCSRVSSDIIYMHVSSFIDIIEYVELFIWTMDKSSYTYINKNLIKRYENSLMDNQAII